MNAVLRALTLGLVFSPMVMGALPEMPPVELDKEKIDKEWDELAAQWECPDWFKDAKLGLWICWGPCTQNDAALDLTVPGRRPSKYVTALKIEGATR